MQLYVTIANPCTMLFPSLLSAELLNLMSPPRTTLKRRGGKKVLERGALGVWEFKKRQGLLQLYERKTC